MKSDATMTVVTYPLIKSIQRDSPGFPKRLLSAFRDKAPETIQYLGNLELLNQPSLGFCGSRNVTDKGLSIAEDCAEQAVARGHVVVSGNARGVDRMVHMTALKNGGATILVLPEGIQHFRINMELQPYWDWNRVLVLSEFPADTPWKTWNAMKRNKTILALVKTMIVIEAGEKGGTVAAGEAALKMGVPLYVVHRTDAEASKGGGYLLQRGGMKLMKDRNTGKASMNNVFSQNAEHSSQNTPRYVEVSLY